jgi:competence ComEA-like helix-hairpin-helix protein
MKKLIFVLLLIPLIFAACDEGQIDVNSASIYELDELSGIGEVKAQGIVDSRPYETLDDLVNAYGIGPATLEKIKSQGLACIEGEEEQEEKPVEEEQIKKEEEENEIKEEIANEENEGKEVETIHLNPKTFKTKDSSQVTEKRDYSKYLIFLFCLILGFLYLRKEKHEKRKKKGKEEKRKKRRINEWS